MEYDTLTALIVVDMQNDFADPRGSFYVQGGEQIIDRINEEIEAARRATSTIVYTQDWHPMRTPHFDIDGGRWPVHCVRDTWGAELHPRLTRIEEALVVKKGLDDNDDGYSAFTVHDKSTGAVTPTGLGLTLWDRGIIRAAVVGLAEDVCVKATALDARKHDLITTIISAATRPVDEETVEASRETMRRAGITFE